MSDESTKYPFQSSSFCLDDRYSTTRKVIKLSKQEIGKQSKIVSLRNDNGHILVYGGLRTNGFFKISSANQFRDNNPKSILSHNTDKKHLALTTNDFVKCDNDEMAFNPLVTIVSVVFNGEKFLEETILSVLNQTYDNVEYIIIDGGSTDGTLDIIRKYEHAIDFWLSENDKGIYDAMNKGIDIASGDWINFMNGGDGFYEPSVLSEVFSRRYYKNAKIIYGDHQVIYPSGRKRFASAGPIKNIWKGSQFCHQSSFIECKYHKRHKFNIGTKIVADYEFFYEAWKANIRFEFVKLIISKFQAGGVSDVKRIDSIVGRWNIIDKSFTVNIYYLFLVFKEFCKMNIKSLFKFIRI